MSKVPPGGRCESDEGSTDGVEDGDGAGEASNNVDGAGIGGEPSDTADRIPSECDGNDSVVGMCLLKKECRPLILSRIDSNICFAIADEAMAYRH